MKKIVAHLQPFVLKSTLYIFENSNRIGIEEILNTSLSSNIFTIAEKYNVQEIEFMGSKPYIIGLIKQLEKVQFAKYNMVKFTIRYKER